MYRKAAILIFKSLMPSTQAEATASLWEKFKRENSSLKSELAEKTDVEDCMSTSANTRKLESNFKAEKARLREDLKCLQALYEQDLNRMRLRAEAAEKQLAELKSSSVNTEIDTTKAREQLLSPNEDSPDHGNQVQTRKNYNHRMCIQLLAFSYIHKSAGFFNSLVGTEKPS